MKLQDEKKLKKIQRLLSAKEQTLAVAESVTTGLLQHAFGSTPCASEFFQGGITVYNAGQKYKHLQVEPIHALACNCVSQKVADDMALHCIAMFRSDWGIGITGYATPVTESRNKVFAFFSIACRDKIMLQKKLVTSLEDPFAIQFFYTSSVINQLIKLL